MHLLGTLCTLSALPPIEPDSSMIFPFNFHPTQHCFHPLIHPLTHHLRLVPPNPAPARPLPRRVVKFVLDERVEKLGLVSLAPTGQVIYANASFERMLGYDQAGGCGMVWGICVAGALVCVCRSEVKAVSTAGWAMVSLQVTRPSALLCIETGGIYCMQATC